MSPEEMVLRALKSAAADPNRLAALLAAPLEIERSRASAARGQALAERLAAQVAAGSVDPGLIVSQFNIQIGKDLARTVREYNDLLKIGDPISHPRGAIQASNLQLTLQRDTLLSYFSTPSPLDAVLRDLNGQR